MMQYSLIWPDDFDSSSWLIESKGWFVGLEIVVEGKTLRPTFYDPVRLAQDVACEIDHAGVFAERCVVVVARVTRGTIESTIADLAETGELRRLM